MTATTQEMIHHQNDKRVMNKPKAIFKRMDLSDVNHTEVTLVEASLKATWFATNAQGDRHDTGHNKIIQIPQTLFIALACGPRPKSLTWSFAASNPARPP